MLAAGCTAVCQKAAVDEMGWKLATVIDLGFGAAFILAFCILGKSESVIVEVATRRGVALAALAGLSGATAFFCGNVAMSRVAASLVIPVIAAAPAVSLVFAHLMLGEKMSQQQIGGAVLALIGAYAVATGK